MVNIYGIIKVPKDWFDVFVVQKEGEKEKNSKIHSVGTTFRSKNLLELFPDKKDRLLKACDVSLKKTQEGYVFFLKELSK